MSTSRAIASAWVAETLARRQDLLARVSDGAVGLKEAFAECDSDERLVGLRTLALVEACPGRQKVMTRRSFAAIGIDEFASVGDLDERARTALVSLKPDGSR